MADRFFRGDTNILFIEQNGTFYPVACLTSNGISESIESLDTTTVANQGWTTSVPTIQSYSISFEGLQVNDETLTQLSIFRLRQIKRSRQVFRWEIRTNTGQFVDFGTGFLTNIEQVAAVDEFITFSGTIVGVGVLSQSTGPLGSVTWDRTDITFDDTNVTFDKT